MNYKQIVIGILMVSFLVSLGTVATAQEPTKPAVDFTFDSEKEDKIKEVAGLSLQDAIERLKSPDFFFDEDLLHKAIFIAFKDKKQEAIALALNQLKFPRLKMVDGKLVSRTNYLYIAKKIFQIFPEEAVESILEIYETGSAITKGNIIQTLGLVAGGDTVRNMLIEALDDKTFCEEEYPDMEGKPLRICDVAYNQLVLRYEIKDVLRTIGLVHKIENRDYHINILKDKLKL